MTLVKFALGSIAGVLVTYGIGAFVAWDFNAGSWDIIGRAMIGLCAPLVGAIFGLIAIDEGGF